MTLAEEMQRNERSLLRGALDRQGRADTSEAWLADQNAIDASLRRMAELGLDPIAERVAIERELSALPVTES